MAMQLSNYLFFTTTCKQALEFYAECGLGKVDVKLLDLDKVLHIRILDEAV
jgi:uncharacterized glyoxalase superfamily protein PhnB